MPQQIGWSVEAKLLYEIKQLTKQLSGREYIAVYANFAAFPIPGVTGTLYVDQSTGDIYVWNGTSYVLLSAGITALNGLIAAAQLFATGSTGTDFNISSVGTTHTFNIPTASAANRGLLSSTDWTTFNNKQNAITLTTTGTSGAATLVGSTLNIPQYQSALTNPITGTGTTNYLSKFTGTTTLGNSQIFDNGTNVGIGFTPSTLWNSRLQVKMPSTTLYQGISVQSSTNESGIYIGHNATVGAIGTTFGASGAYTPLTFLTSDAERMRIFANGRVGINTTTDAGYQFDVAGSIRNTTDAYFATSSGNVGIGTTSVNAGRKLQINGDSSDSFIQLVTTTSGTTSSDGLLIGVGNGLDAYILNYEISPLRLFTSGSERMRITSGGNVGIGTTSPGSILHAVSSNSEGFILDGIGAQGTRIEIRTNNTAISYFGDGRNIFGAGYNNSTVLSTGGANFMAFGTNLTERMRITATGDVGIGTTSPQGKLDVDGPILIGNGLLTHQTNRGVLEYANSITSLRSYGANSGDGTITLRTGGGGGSADVERVRIKSDGKVLIGTTTDAGAYALQVAGSIYNTTGAVFAASSGNVGIGTTSPAEKLQVVGNILASDNAGAYPRFISTVGAKSWEIGYRSGTTNYEIREDGNTRLVIANGGNVGIGTTSPTAKLQVNGNTVIGTGSPSGLLTVRDLSTSTAIVVDGGPASSGLFSARNNGTENAYLSARGDISAVLVRSRNWIMDVGTEASQPLTLSTSGLVRMHITSTGNVGIGTTSPSGILDVSRSTSGGDVRVYMRNTATTASSTFTLDLSEDGLLRSGIQYSPNTGETKFGNITTGNYPVTFYAGATERMRITSGGNVLIGTTVDSGARLQSVSSGIVGLSVNTSGNDIAYFQRTNAGNALVQYTSFDTTSDIIHRFRLNSGAGNFFDLRYYGNSNYFSIDYNGNIGIAVNSSLNVGIGQTTFGTSATRTFAISTGVAPTTSPVDAIQMYSADVVAGNAAPHFRTENGAVVKVYQETTGVGAATFVQGSVNAVYEDSTFDGYTLKQIVKALRNQGLLA